MSRCKHAEQVLLAYTALAEGHAGVAWCVDCGTLIETTYSRRGLHTVWREPRRRRRDRAKR